MIMRKAGYAYFRDPKTGSDSFVKRLYGGFYPRLHLYLKEEGQYLTFNLHLDQKQASYKGADHMHNADYDGEIVTQEIARIKQIILSLRNSQTDESSAKPSGYKSPLNNDSQPWYKFW